MFIEDFPESDENKEEFKEITPDKFKDELNNYAQKLFEEIERMHNTFKTPIKTNDINKLKTDITDSKNFYFTDYNGKVTSEESAKYIVLEINGTSIVYDYNDYKKHFKNGNKISKMSGRPERKTSINNDDIINLKIDLNSCNTIDELLERM
jgi:predicted small metal-binding protein